MQTSTVQVAWPKSRGMKVSLCTPGQTFRDGSIIRFAWYTCQRYKENCPSLPLPSDLSDLRQLCVLFSRQHRYKRWLCTIITVPECLRCASYMAVCGALNPEQTHVQYTTPSLFILSPAQSPCSSHTPDSPSPVLLSSHPLCPPYHPQPSPHPP